MYVEVLEKEDRKKKCWLNFEVSWIECTILEGSCSIETTHISSGHQIILKYMRVSAREAAWYSTRGKAFANTERNGIFLVWLYQIL